jgi:hypothetical protein
VNAGEAPEGTAARPWTRLQELRRLPQWDCHGKSGFPRFNKINNSHECTLLILVWIYKEISTLWNECQGNGGG